MKKIIIVYDDVEEYQLAYRKYTEGGFSVSVVVGIELALCIQGDEVAWLSIVKADKYINEKYGW
jgi:hypothetical protein